MAQRKRVPENDSNDSLVVRYRVTKDEYQRLSLQAKKYKMSPHLYARQLAFDTLDNAERARLFGEIELLQSQVAQLSSRVQVINDFALDLDAEVQTLKGKPAAAGRR